MHEGERTITGFTELTRLCTALMVKMALGSGPKSISVEASGIDDRGDFDIHIKADCNAYFSAFAAGILIGQISKVDYEDLSEEKLSGMRLLMAAGASVARADEDTAIDEHLLAGIYDIERLTRGALADDDYMLSFIGNLTRRDGGHAEETEE